MKRKILYISGTRADYGFMQGVLKKINTHPDLELEVIVTGMHLMKEFGYTLNSIQKDGFRLYKIPAKFDSSEMSVVNFLGVFLKKLTLAINKIHPDIILVAGDRAEMLGGAIVASYCSLPLAHVSGGDVTSTIDEHIRHAITKLANIHFPYTALSADRIYKMGEDRWRIHIVGSPGVYKMLNQKIIPKEKIGKKYGLDSSKPFLLMIQHPVTFEEDEAPEQIRRTLKAIIDLRIQTILIYPNADSGGMMMINVIREFEKNPYIRTFKTIPSEEFFSLMKFAGAMIGNSSSGIVEAPSFKLPVINIGPRQQGRERASNVIDVDYNTEKIKKAIKIALYNREFLDIVKTCENPYDNGDAASQIVEVLASIKINHKLLQKKLRY